jgi:acyl phosphate:glycerol-3-phosphate acyltransferase
MMYLTQIAAAVLVGYLLGSIPFGLILTRLAGTEDLRGVGSGNIGATNVLRTGHKALAAATLLLDAGKGFAAVTIAALWWPGVEVMAGAGAMLGHCFPVWLRFRGGKGVATLIGVSFALGPVIGFTCLGVWIAVALITRISSLAGISAAITAPLAAVVNGYDRYAGVLAVLTLLVLVQHRANIARIRAGTEPRFGASPDL